jgi:hypothetical protein
VIQQFLQLFKVAGNCGTNTGVWPGLYNGLPCNANGDPQLQSVSDALKVVGNVVQILIFAAGGLAVFFVIVGAILWIASGGDPGRIKTGRDMMTNAVVGLLIVIASYAVMHFIAQGF